MLWVKQGGTNSRFLHKLAFAHQIENRIAELKLDKGQIAITQEDIEVTGKEYFATLFSKDQTNRDSTQLEMVKAIPKLVTKEMNSKLIKEVSMDELRNVVSTLQPDKPPGPDGSKQMSIKQHGRSLRMIFSRW